MVDLGTCMIVAAVADRMQAEAASTPTPLQALARAIKALSYRDMERLSATVRLMGNETKLVSDISNAILAAADKLEAGE